jgi:signal transduction histidine kinase
MLFWRFFLLTIRARLLWLTIGLVVPLLLVGFYNLWEAWQVSREQLNESIERQAELAATAFEQWIEAQTQTLTTISTLAASDNPATLKDYLNSIIKTRPHWLDVQIVNSSGEVVLSQTVRDKPLPLVSIETLKQEVAAKKSLVILTEQISEENLRLLSLALPLANGNFVVARIDGASASNVFKELNLPEENIIAVFDPNRRLLYRSNVSPEQVSSDVSSTPLLSALNNKQTATVEVESPYDKIRRVYGLARIEAANCVVAVGVPSENLYAPAKQQYWRQLWVGSVITSLAILLVLFIARSVVEPMRRLTDAAQAFGAGDLHARTEITGGSPVRELGETFNQMAEQIAEREEKSKELDRLKSEFVSSVSHELRTPLTTIKTLTRVLQRNDISESESAEYLKTIAVECDRQIEFVQNLLDLSRIESGAYRVSLVKTDVVEILLNGVEANLRAAITRGVSLKFNAPDEILPPVLTDAPTLRRIVSSLIENAMKYTPDGGEINVSAERRGEQIAVKVSDNGCGIAAEDLPRIFERFYRGRPLKTKKDDRERSNETSGIGLGLYLVKSLVEQIQGEIFAESPVDGQGSRFTVLLPIYHKLSENTQ